jgi:hypothetical protein
MTEQRPPRLRTWLIAGPAVGAALLGLVVAPAGAGTGGGSGDSGNGKNNGAGNDKKDYTISGTATGLYPGAARPLVLTFTNATTYANSVATFGVSVTPPNPACTAANVRVDALPPNVVVPANGSTTRTVLVRMSNDSPNACKDATFGLTYSGTAVKA